MEKNESESQAAVQERQIFAEYPVPRAVAAVSLCLPVYNIMTAISNLFGIGGSSVIARALGTKEESRAKNAFALSIRGAFITAAAYALLLALIAKPFLLVIGGLPTVLSTVFAHLIRCTGNSKTAGFGITLGAVLNMVLDPLFMFVILPKGNEVLGAAIATAISNTTAMLFFLFYMIRNKKDSIFCFLPKITDHSSKLTWDIIKCGIPSFFLLAAGQISNFFLNGMLAEMGSSAAVAGMGIVRKIDSVAYAVNQGITQGMLPIVAYCYTSGKHQRMKAVVGFSAVCTICFSLLCGILSFVFAPQLISFFIRENDTVYYGTYFLRIICISVMIYPLLFVVIAVFQAVGQSVRPFLLSLVNKGSLDIVLFFVIERIFGLEYILWATPVMAAIALIAGIISAIQFFRTVPEKR